MLCARQRKIDCNDAGEEKPPDAKRAPLDVPRSVEKEDEVDATRSVNEDSAPGGSDGIQMITASASASTLVSDTVAVVLPKAQMLMLRPAQQLAQLELRLGSFVWPDGSTLGPTPLSATGSSPVQRVQDLELLLGVSDVSAWLPTRIRALIVAADEQGW